MASDELSNTVTGTWTDDRVRLVTLLGIGIGASLASRLIACVSMGYSVDDLRYWELPTFGYSDVLRHAMLEGRFSYPFLAGIFQSFGIVAPRTPTLSAVVLSTCLAMTAVLLCHIWRIQKDVFASAAVVLIFVMHPYFTDLFLWKMGMLTGGIPFVAGLAAMLIGRSSWWGCAAGTAIFVLTLGVHQLPLPICASAWIVAVLLDILRKRPETLIQSTRSALVLIFGTAIYVVAAKLLIASYGLPSTNKRDVLILLSHPTLVAERALELFRMMLLSDVLISGYTRLVATSLAIASIALLLLQQGRKQIVSAIAMPIMLIAIGMAAVALSIVPENWIPFYRNLSAIAVAWAAVVAIAMTLTLNRHIRIAVGTAVAIIAFAFAGKNGEMLTDQQRQSLRDRDLMNRIVMRLERLPGYESARSVEFVGTNSTSILGLNTAADISHGWGAYGSTYSSFAAFFGEKVYLQHLYREVSGRVPPTWNQTNHDVARKTCATRQVYWPLPESVQLVDGIAVVCLSAPATVIPGPFNVRW